MIARAAALVSSPRCRARRRADGVRWRRSLPDGSAWAREFRSFSRRVETATEGRVRVKWYYNGVAGDEQEELDRIHRNQMDGAAFGLFCDRLSPTIRVTRVPGLFQGLDEATAIMNVLRPDIDKEAHQAGFVILGSSALGPEDAVLALAGAEVRRAAPRCACGAGTSTSSAICCRRAWV